MNCKGCNNELDKEASFCKHCGKKIELSDEIKRISESMDKHTKQLEFVTEFIVIQSMFYGENPKIRKMFLKFLENKEKLFKKLKEQGKYDDFIERYIERDDEKYKSIKSKASSKKKGKNGHRTPNIQRLYSRRTIKAVQKS